MSEIDYTINHICEKFGYAVSEIIPQYAKYSIICDAVWIIVGIIISAIGIYLIRRINKRIKNDDYSYYEEPFWRLGGAISLLVLGIIFITVDVVSIVGWATMPKMMMYKAVIHALANSN